MEYMEEPRFEMNAEIRDQIKAELEAKFPHVEFRAYSWDSEHHSIAMNNADFTDSPEYLQFLGELEKRYAPDYDIFDMGFVYKDFDNLDKHLNALKNKAKSI